jgi:hypothetical protein
VTEGGGTVRMKLIHGQEDDRVQMNFAPLPTRVLCDGRGWNLVG